MSLDELDDLERRVEKLPDCAHKTLMEYELKSIRKMLQNIEEAS